MPRSEPSVPVLEPARSNRPRMLLLPLIAIAGFFATIMFAAAAQGLPQFGGWLVDAEPRAGEGTGPTAPAETAPLRWILSAARDHRAIAALDDRDYVRPDDVATGQSDDDSRYRRSPVVPPGSIIFVLSTFFDGAAAQLVTRWRASGHAVVAVDVLPAPEGSRLTREQRIALRTLLAERSDILVELRHAGVEVVRWTESDACACGCRARAHPARTARRRGARRRRPAGPARRPESGCSAS